MVRPPMRRWGAIGAILIAIVSTMLLYHQLPRPEDRSRDEDAICAAMKSLDASARDGFRGVRGDPVDPSLKGTFRSRLAIPDGKCVFHDFGDLAWVTCDVADVKRSLEARSRNAIFVTILERCFDASAKPADALNDDEPLATRMIESKSLVMVDGIEHSVGVSALGGDYWVSYSVQRSVETVGEQRMSAALEHAGSDDWCRRLGEWIDAAPDGFTRIRNGTPSYGVESEPLYWEVAASLPGADSCRVIEYPREKRSFLECGLGAAPDDGRLRDAVKRFADALAKCPAAKGLERRAVDDRDDRFSS